MALTNTSKEDQKGNSKDNSKVKSKVNKKKEITCYKCKQTGHYANECKEDDHTVKASDKKGLNFQVINKDAVSSDENDA